VACSKVLIQIRAFAKTFIPSGPLGAFEDLRLSKSMTEFDVGYFSSEPPYQKNGCKTGKTQPFEGAL
jgi:hypothetical protein